MSSKLLIGLFVAMLAMSTFADDGIAKKRTGGLSALIGNTVHGTDMVDGEEYWQYFRADGTGANVFSNGDINTFSWTQNGSMMCMSYSDGTECSRFAISGHSGTETGVSGAGAGHSSNFELLSGNARGL